MCARGYICAFWLYLKFISVSAQLCDVSGTLLFALQGYHKNRSHRSIMPTRKSKLNATKCIIWFSRNKNIFEINKTKNMLMIFSLRLMFCLSYHSNGMYKLYILDFVDAQFHRIFSLRALIRRQRMNKPFLQLLMHSDEFSSVVENHRYRDKRMFLEIVRAFLHFLVFEQVLI